MTTTKILLKVGRFMSKLNQFHKDLMILMTLLLLQVVFSLLFPLTNHTASSIEVTRNFLTLTIESGGQTHTYLPILPALYMMIMLVMLLRKNKPLTVIYGIGLMLLTKVNFISQLYQLEGQVNNVSFGNFWLKTVRVDGAVQAQDITIYVIIVLILIKTGIIVYQKINKYLEHRRIDQNPHHETI